MGRWLRFLLAIAVGFGAGLLYGWRVNPVGYSETALNTLRIDYRTDYVLMVAEAYQAEQDIELALHRLALLQPASPQQAVSEAINFAESYGYAELDLLQMHALADELRLSQVPVETMQP